MRILAPIDGSDCSFRALDFAIQMARQFDADLHVVHFSDAETSGTETILERAQKVLAEADTAVDPELVLENEEIRRANAVGEAILDYAEAEAYDHVVMGHHSDSRVERAIIGSAAETVLRAEVVPVTIVP